MEYFPLILLALAFVLLIVLPARQRKKMAAQAQQMQEALQAGTPIMTTSGIHGTVIGKTDSTVDVEIAPGVVITLARQAILEVRKPAAGAHDDIAGAAAHDDIAGDDSHRERPGGASASGDVPGVVDGGPTEPTR